jgi:integrase
MYYVYDFSLLVFRNILQVVPAKENTSMARFKDTREWRIISEEDAAKVIAHSSARWKLPTKLLYHYGLRVSEVLSITPANVRDGLFVVPRLKHSDTPQHAIVESLREELLELVAGKAPGVRLFPWTRWAFYQAIQCAGFRAGVDEAFLHPHSFRHAAGRRWARAQPLTS